MPCYAAHTDAQVLALAYKQNPHARAEAIQRGLIADPELLRCRHVAQPPRPTGNGFGFQADRGSATIQETKKP